MIHPDRLADNEIAQLRDQLRHLEAERDRLREALRDLVGKLDEVGAASCGGGYLNESDMTGARVALGQAGAGEGGEDE